MTLELGALMADGSVYAGDTADGQLMIFAMPYDLDIKMTFNKAAKAVKKINKKNSLGHDDWEIPALDTLKVLFNNKNKGALKGSFNYTPTKGDDLVFPGWYWSSTKDKERNYLHAIHNVHFSHGAFVETCAHKNDGRFNCRPVRLVAASSAPVPAPK